MTPDAATPLAILACGGPLPHEVARAAVQSGRPVFVVGIEGFAGNWIGDYPHCFVSIGQVGRMLLSWRTAGCRDLVIAGAMRRPNLWRVRVDAGFFRAIRTALSLTRGGDDSMLRRVIGFFEREGFRVVGPHTVAPHLLATAGALSCALPNDRDHHAIDRAGAVIATLGRFDVGQAAVATEHLVLALEGAKGTDAMLVDVARLAGERARGGVLVKLPKPGQEMRIDLPTIGPETVRRAAAAGLAGIAIGAGQSLVLERAEVAALADADGLFVVGIEPRMSEPAEERARLPHRAPVALGRIRPRAPELADIALGRRVLEALARYTAGRGVVVAGERVLAIDAALPLSDVVQALGRSSHWGMRAFRRRIGVLVVGDCWNEAGANIETVLDAAVTSGLAGVALTTVPAADVSAAITGAADVRGLFVVAVGPAEDLGADGGAHA